MTARLLAAGAGLALLLAALSSPVSAHHESVANCAPTAGLVRLNQPLPATAAAIKRDKRLLAVAIGSSSTAGYGATDLAHAYPARLAEELKRRWPSSDVSVVNRGIGGETVDQMLRRFENDVIALKPQLVLWQLGSNSVLKGGGVAGFEDALRRGIERLRAAQADVILIDVQYAPRILSGASYADVLRILSAVAGELDVALFRRFALMKHWVESGRAGHDVLLSADQLHMSDAGYACVAHALADAIYDAVVGVPADIVVRRH